MPQVMEDGQLTDSTGRTVSFKNCLIVLTSNVGSSVIAKGEGTLGFSLPSSSEDTSYNSIHSLVMDELKVCRHEILLVVAVHRFLFYSDSLKSVAAAATHILEDLLI